MNRRDMLRGGAGIAALASVAACKPGDTSAAGSVKVAQGKPLRWKMVTTWPKNFPALGTGANRLAELITVMSGGRIDVSVYGAGELVPAFEVFDAVSRGTAQIGHGSAYYWKGKVPAAQFFSTIPFGLTAQEIKGWLQHGGGHALWTKLYEQHGLLPFDAGNTTVQVAGWFNKEINTVNDLKGLKMRIPGLGGEALRALGVTVQNIPGGELFQALSDGTIDATEWVGPFNDLAFGLHRAAKYCYFPGWHEPGTVLEAVVNRDAFNGLPDDLQAIVRAACEVTSSEMIAEFTARNGRALQTLIEQHKVDVRALPPAVLAALRASANSVTRQLGESSDTAREIYDSYLAYRDTVVPWTRMAEQAYLEARDQAP